MLSKLWRWFRGEFVCIVCGKTYYLNTFGYGWCVCPTHYRGETATVCHDANFFLNRLFYWYLTKGGHLAECPTVMLRNQ